MLLLGGRFTVPGPVARRFPATFTFVLRAFATLEGIGKILDPEFSFAQVAAPYAQELLDLQVRGVARRGCRAPGWNS